MKWPEQKKKKTNKSNSKMPSQMAKKTQIELCSLLYVHNNYVDNNVALALVSFSLEKHLNSLCIRA